MASLLETSANKKKRLYALLASLAAHVVLVAALFLLPSTRTKIYVPEIPRNVKLLATLEEPPAPKPLPPKAVKPKAPPKPKTAPKPKVKPKLVKPVPRPVKRVTSKIKVPVKTAPPLVKPRKPSAEPVSALKDSINLRRADIAKAPAEPSPARLPELAVPKVTPVAVPELAPTPANLSPRDKLVPLSDFPYPLYINNIMDIIDRWEPPSSYSLRGQPKPSVISIRIARDGKVSVLSQESSGHRSLDRSALAFMKGITAFPPLPAGYKENFFDVGIRFNVKDE